MSVYRLYCRQDGRLISTAMIEADDDAAAVDQLCVQPGIQYELWLGSRLVAFLAGRDADERD